MESRTKENLRPNQENMRMFFIVFVLFTSRWSVRKVIDCFLMGTLCKNVKYVKITSHSVGEKSCLKDYLR